MSALGMTPGDVRAEADRLAKARGPAYAEGYAAALVAVIARLKEGQREMQGPYEAEMLGLAIEAVDDLMEGR